jgi:hypothetical protein
MMCSSTRLPTREGYRRLCGLFLMAFVSNGLWAEDCPAVRAAESKARGVVDADIAAINQMKLNFRLTASALDDWAAMSAAQKTKLYQTAVLNLIQGALTAPFVGTAAGNVSLPNGIASIGTGQAAALQNMLRTNGVDDPILSGLISKASMVAGKPEAKDVGLKILDHLSTASQAGMDLFGDDKAEAMAPVAQFGLGLMGPAYAGYATALGAGSDALTLVQSLYMASNAGNQIFQLTKINETTLSELTTRISKLRGDVQALHISKASSVRVPIWVLTDSGYSVRLGNTSSSPTRVIHITRPSVASSGFSREKERS